jgi:hypothetical protein
MTVLSCTVMNQWPLRVKAPSAVTHGLLLLSGGSGRPVSAIHQPRGVTSLEMSMSGAAPGALCVLGWRRPVVLLLRFRARVVGDQLEGSRPHGPTFTSSRGRREMSEVTATLAFVATCKEHSRGQY